MAAWRQAFKGAGVGLVLVTASSPQVIAGDVVSTSLCSDAFVLALSNPEQIKALSWQVEGPLSLAPPFARTLPKARPDAEILLRLAPADIVMGPGDRTASATLAVRRGSRLYHLKWQDSFDGIAQNLQELGQFLGRSAQARATISRQHEQLVMLQQRTLARPRQLRVLYLTPTLGTAGQGTYVDAAIRAAGGINFANRLGISGWGQIPVEQLVKAKPDLIISSFFGDGPPSALNFRSNHPQMQALRRDVPEQTIAGGLWICAGPSLIQAANEIADRLDLIAKGASE